MEESES